LLAAQNHGSIHYDRKRIYVISLIVCANVKGGVFLNGASRDGTRLRLPLTAAVGKEVTGALRFILRLVLHVHARAPCETDKKQPNRDKGWSQASAFRLAPR
jgi:hypothetical protein